MILTTANNVDGFLVSKQLGIVTGECALGTGIFSSLSSSLADGLGVNSTSYSKKLNDAKNYAMLEIKRKANELNADAIIAIDIDYVNFTSDIIGVVVSGTAVCLQDIRKKEDIPSQYKNFSYDVPQFIMDGNIDIHKVLISMEENSKNIFLSVGGKNKSGRNIEGLLLEIELLSPFEKVLWKSTIEFFQITKNGDLFTTNYKQIEFPNFCEERILFAKISMKNIFADGRKLYTTKE